MSPSILTSFEPAEVLRIPQSPSQRGLVVLRQGAGSPLLRLSPAGTIRMAQKSSPPLPPPPCLCAPRRMRVPEDPSDPGAGRSCGSARSRSFFPLPSPPPAFEPAAGLRLRSFLSAVGSSFLGGGELCTPDPTGNDLPSSPSRTLRPLFPRAEPFALGRPVPESIHPIPPRRYLHPPRLPVSLALGAAPVHRWPTSVRAQVPSSLDRHLVTEEPES